MKQGWEIKKLGEVAIFVNGDRGKNYPSQHDFVDDGVPFINAGHLVGGSIDFALMNYISEEKYNQLGAGKIVNGDILFCLRGSLGKRAIVKDVNYGAIASSLVIIRSKNVLLNRYLFHYLGSHTVQNLITKNDNGSSQPNLSAKSVSDFSIPIPSREEQERIVAELDCLSGIIEKKREQLRELDALAQSIFYQMFGDPITNEKGWEIKKLGEIATSQIGITYKPENVSDNDEGTIVLRSSNIQNSTLCFEDIVRVKCEIKENKYVKDGDILMCSRNGSFRLVGKVAMIANLLEPMTYGAFMTIIRSPYQAYLFAFFKSPAFRAQLTTSKTATINQITVKMLDEIKVALPPLILQQEFADKIEAIEKQKELIKKSISETETLFNARMEYYFN